MESLFKPKKYAGLWRTAWIRAALYVAMLCITDSKPGLFSKQVQPCYYTSPHPSPVWRSTNHARKFNDVITPHPTPTPCIPMCGVASIMRASLTMLLQPTPPNPYPMYGVASTMPVRSSMLLGLAAPQTHVWHSPMYGVVPTMRSNSTMPLHLTPLHPAPAAYVA